jgi:hypothetical protein
MIMKEGNSGPELRSSYTEVKLIPILLGKKKGDLTQAVNCDESYAVKI